MRIFPLSLNNFYLALLAVYIYTRNIINKHAFRKNIFRKDLLTLDARVVRVILDIRAIKMTMSQMSLRLLLGKKISYGTRGIYLKILKINVLLNFSGFIFP